MTAPPVATGLYDPRHEHDACGVGFVVDIKGRRSHAVVEQGLEVLGWRALSIDDRALGESARAARPVIEQVCIATRNRRVAGDPGDDDAAAQARLERKLYVVRKRVEHAADQLPIVERHAFYIPSLSSQTLIYKGM